MEQRFEDFAIRRERERKAHFFAMNPRNLEIIMKMTMGKIQKFYRQRAACLGLEGETFVDWTEDVASESLYLSEKNIAKWDPTRGPDWNWILLHAKSLASRWLDNLETEFRKLERLGQAITSSNFLREAESSPTHMVDQRVSIEQMLEAEFSETQQRVLRLSIDGLSIKEIAAMEQCSEGTAQRNLNRAQAKARKLAPLYGFEGRRAPPGPVPPPPPIEPKSSLDKAAIAPKRPQIRSSTT